MVDIHDLPNEPTVALIACGKSKVDLDDGETIEAENLYTSTFMQIKQEFGNTFCDEFRILSAEHNLTHPQDQLEEYDASLVPRHDVYIGDENVIQWGEDTREELAEYHESRPDNTIYVILASGNYLKQIQPFLEDKRTFTPFEDGNFGGNGDQMGWMRTQMDKYTDDSQTQLSGSWE